MMKVHCKEMLELTERRVRGLGGGRPQTPDIVQDEIVRLYRGNKLTCREIAEAVGVSEGTVYRTSNRRTRRGE